MPVDPAGTQGACTESTEWQSIYVQVLSAIVRLSLLAMLLYARLVLGFEPLPRFSELPSEASRPCREHERLHATAAQVFLSPSQ